MEPMAALTFYDWLFIISAILFNLLIAGIFIAQKHGREGWVNTLGRLWLLLSFPLLAVFINYALLGKADWLLALFWVIFFYMLVEFVLDYVLKFDFRARWLTHAPYILLEYVALFSIIAIAINQPHPWLGGGCLFLDTDG
ncbi:MAG: hypothetical protein DWQ07_10480 [Chloroflexi bacterium]|nr:MAG: hypothetical protein DWQ07_10480 [Chloroflexota bacterium]MBL1192862.1 hypothetical protein [Chloroflexota bacterium]NOH10155.1 hypothetical protein [Chloroflexota bacterium]